MLEQIEKLLKESVQAELLAQKHNASGKLSDSVEVTNRTENGTIFIEGAFLSYGKYVDLGRAKGVNKVPVQALIEWVKLKNIASGDEAKSVAFAIREKIFQEGIPTRGSRQIASKRLNFVGETLKKVEPKLIQLIEEMDRALKVAQLDNIIRNTQTKLR